MYGGGSKANRYIDVLDLNTVEVSQGTADISSRSNEALGGTLNFLTSLPLQESNLNLTAMIGDQDAHKYRVRYDTDEFLPNTYAFVSASTSDSKDFIDGKATSQHDYATAKIISELNGYKLTGFITHTSANENEYDSVKLAQYNADPTHDNLTMHWTGIPAKDQNYRAAWRALRKNTLSYVTIAKDFGAFNFTTSLYNHNMTGRGDWLPPYINDVTNDGAGVANSELDRGNTVFGGDSLSKIYFVNPDGTTAIPVAGCEPRNGLDAEEDPICYADNVTPVSSYRTSNYKNRRSGITADMEYDFSIGNIENTLRAGFWYENYDAEVTRKWHKVNDSLIGPAFDNTAYWVQYHEKANTKETMYYLQNNATFGAVTGSIGIKQYHVDITYDQPIGNGVHNELTSNSDPLLYAGLNYKTALNGLELFTGYSENYAAINTGIVGDVENVKDLDGLEPETATNIELGARYNTGDIMLSATYYSVDFDNHIVNIDHNTVTGINYLDQSDSDYVNVGGIKSNGIELLASYQINSRLRLSGSYTYNNAEYVGTGSDALDAEAEIQPGNQVYASPENIVNLALDYVGDAMSAGMSVRNVGDRYIDFDNVEVAPSYYVSDLYVGADLENLNSKLKGLHARLNINNVLDNQYINGVSSGSVFPSAPRTVTFSVSSDW